MADDYITFKNVSLAYNSDNPEHKKYALKNVSLNVKKG